MLTNEFDRAVEKANLNLSDLFAREHIKLLSKPICALSLASLEELPSLSFSKTDQILFQLKKTLKDKKELELVSFLRVNSWNFYRCLTQYVSLLQFSKVYGFSHIKLEPKTQGAFDGCIILVDAFTEKKTMQEKVLPNDEISHKQLYLDFFENLLDKYPLKFYGSLGQCKKYYVKMHCRGSLRENDNNPRQLIISEMHTYKLLELLQLGPKVHFLSFSRVYTWIITEDISELGFISWEDWRRTDQYSKHLKNIQNNELTEQDVKLVENITRLHFLCTVLGLHDVLSNPQNLFVNQDLTFKTVDFLHNFDVFTMEELLQELHAQKEKYDPLVKEIVKRTKEKSTVVKWISELKEELSAFVTIDTSTSIPYFNTDSRSCFKSYITCILPYLQYTLTK